MRTNKLRTLLTGLAVAWGILMLIVLLSVSNGVINSFHSNMGNMDVNAIEVFGGRTTMAYQGFKEGRQITLKEEDIDRIKDLHDQSIQDVTAEFSYRVEVSTPRDYLPSKNCTGVFPQDFKNKLIQGRRINDSDVQQARKVMILPRSSVSVLFADTLDVIGRTVKAGGVAFTVVGVAEPRFGDEEIYIPYTTAIALTGYTGNVDKLCIHLREGSSVDDSKRVTDLVLTTLSKAHQVHPADRSAFWTFNMVENNEQSLRGLNILNVAMWVIGLLTLVTGIVGVSNIMFVSVRERTHEIGIRRAIGARPRNILTQVVLESVVMTTFFGYIGIVGGTLLTEIVKYVFRGSQFMLNPEVDLSIALKVTIALIIAGAIAGIFPATRALKIKPVEALRDE